jgi:hypothetical protein
MRAADSTAQGQNAKDDPESCHKAPFRKAWQCLWARAYRHVKEGVSSHESRNGQQDTWVRVWERGETVSIRLLSRCP